jgi:hypothetical protein
MRLVRLAGEIRVGLMLPAATPWGHYLYFTVLQK